MEVRTIRDCIDKKSNNLNLIKFIAAILVIFSHPFRISRNTMDPLDSFTDGQISFGGVAVALFLFASGFYVTKGLFKRKKGVLYFKNRFARIYPAFVAVIIATAFIIGPLISKYSFKEYFGRKDTYLYLLYILMIPRYILPGVFEKNPYPGVVNGSLWTIPLEVICYIGLYIVYVCKFLNKKVLKILNPLLLIGICVIFGFRVTGIYKYHLYLRPLLIFFMGIQYYIFRDEIKLDRKKALEILVVAFGLFLLHWGDIAAIYCFPYLFSMLMFSEKQVSEKIASLGNYSYAIYLVAFPIQQIFVSCFGRMDPFTNTLYASICSILFGIGIYHWIEIPFAKLILQVGDNKN